MNLDGQCRHGLLVCRFCITRGERGVPEADETTKGRKAKDRKKAKATGRQKDNRRKAQEADGRAVESDRPGQRRAVHGVRAPRPDVSMLIGSSG